MLTRRMSSWMSVSRSLPLLALAFVASSVVAAHQVTEAGGENAPGEHDAVCRAYLKSFLKGSTDAKDDCEGLLNAYDAADCSDEEDGREGHNFQRWWRWWWSRIFGDDDDDVIDDDNANNEGNSTDDDSMKIDDFYEQFRCCDTIHSYYSVHCHPPQIQSSVVLLIVVVLLLCSLVKTLIRTFRIGWLPEAGGCILVGSMVGALLALKYPERDFAREFSFDDEFFMCVLLPPIVFQASLSIDKKAFRQMFIPISVFAVVGTIMSALLTGLIVHVLSASCPFLTTIPVIDSLVFGSLISSVDPIATLSILGSVGVSDTNVLYVLVFGESLLNDGAAIVLFRSLVQHLDWSVSSMDKSNIVWEIAQRFIAVSFGSAAIGLGCGILCAIYFFLLNGKHPPMLEVSTFFCWALVPYYVADIVGGSGIVAILTLGFFADTFIVGDRQVATVPAAITVDGVVLNEESVEENDSFPRQVCGNCDCSVYAGYGVVNQLFSGTGHLSSSARKHIDFVAEVLASIMETAVFAYMGLFLFAERQFRNMPLNLTAIFACVSSRLIAIAGLSCIMNALVSHRWWLSRQQEERVCSPVIDKHTQLILLLSGMRGAVSVALAENVPLYNAVTGSGSKVKLEIKAMTSSSIIFTVFNFGALTYCILKKRVQLSPSADEEEHPGELERPLLPPLTPPGSISSREELEGSSLE